MQILTTLLSATNTKGTRIRAEMLGSSSYAVRSVTVGYDHALGFGENHAAAAGELMRRNNLSPYISEQCIGVYCDHGNRKMAWTHVHACFTTYTLGVPVVSITRAAY